MSFGTYARKVRNPALAYGRRVNALNGCVERYHPIGYQETFGYLEHLAGPFRRDEEALARAIDALCASRALWLVDLFSFAQRRAEAKRSGRRSLRAGELNPTFASRWYGDARNAAVFAVRYTLRRAEKGRTVSAASADPAVFRLASTCVEGGGRLDPAGLERLADLRREFEGLRSVSGWPDTDWPNWWRAHHSLWMLHHIAVASAPVPAGEPDRPDR